jgi:hypothetical protein
MATPTSTHPEPRRFSIRMPRPLWIGLAAGILIVLAVGLQIGLPIWRHRAASRLITELGGVVAIQEGGPALLRRRIGDERMSVFDRVRSVRFVGVEPVPDAALAELKWLATSEDLEVMVDGGEIGDSSLRHFRSLFGIKTLVLCSTQISDAGLVNLQSLTKIQSLDVSHTHVTDAGLASLNGLHCLRSLNLGYTAVTDNGLEQLREMKNLEELNLTATSVTDAGLVHLQRLPKLRTLFLNLTDTTNAGLKRLSPITSLQNLNLSRTRVTASGVSDLHDAIPSLQIHNWRKYPPGN